MSETSKLLSVNEDIERLGDERRTASLGGSAFNIVNAIMGAGILSMPYAFSHTGLVSGVLLMVLLVVLAVVGLVILGDVATKIDADSFQDVVAHTLGPRWKLFSELLLLVYFLGGAVVFLTILGDSVTAPLQALLHGTRWYTERHFVVGVGALICLPLTFIRQMKWLSPVSFLTIASVLYTVVVIVAYAAPEFSTVELPHPVINLSPEFFFAFPIISFAFQCHVSSVPILRELRNPTPSRRNATFAIAIGQCLLLYIVCGLFGYVFATDPDGDIVNCFSLDDGYQLASRLSVALVSIGSFPIMSYNARLALETLSLYITPRKWPSWLYYVSMVGFVGVACLVAELVTSISTIFKFIGAIGASSFAFMIPGLIVAKHGKSRGARVGGVLLAIFSVLAAVTSIVVTIIGIVDGTPAVHCIYNASASATTGPPDFFF